MSKNEIVKFYDSELNTNCIYSTNKYNIIGLLKELDDNKEHAKQLYNSTWTAIKKCDDIESLRKNKLSTESIQFQNDILIWYICRYVLFDKPLISTDCKRLNLTRAIGRVPLIF